MPKLLKFINEMSQNLKFDRDKKKYNYLVSKPYVTLLFFFRPSRILKKDEFGITWTHTTRLNIMVKLQRVSSNL